MCRSVISHCGGRKRRRSVCTFLAVCVTTNDVFALLKPQVYRSSGTKWITSEEFQDLILRWLEKDLRLVFVNKAAVAILGAPMLAVTAKNAGRQVPKMRDTVDNVPTPLLATVFSIGLMLLQDVRVGRPRQ
jgi:hypothetical protein